MSKQLFFFSNKRIHITSDAEEILKAIENMNIRTIGEDETVRAQQLIDLLNKLGIRIKIPCLLAYEENGIYQDASKLYERVMNEAEEIKAFFNRHPYTFTGFSPEIIFYVFPIESIDRLRDKEKGFYAGLC